MSYESQKLVSGQRVPESPIRIVLIHIFRRLRKIESVGYTIPFFGSTRAALSVKTSFNSEPRLREILIHKTPQTIPSGQEK